MYSANFHRYKKMANQGESDILFKKMRQPTKDLLVELVNEVLRVDSQTKSGSRIMTKNYSKKSLENETA